MSVTDYARTVLASRKLEGLRDFEGDAGRLHVYLEGTPLGAMPLASVRRKDVRDWMKAMIARHAIVGGKEVDRLIAASTAQNALNLVRVVFGRAVEDEVLETSPAIEVKLPNGLKVQRPPRSWTVLLPTEIAALLGVLHGQLRLMFIVAIHSGLRLSELLYLRWSDVRLGADGCIKVTRGRKGGPTKSGKPRTVPLLQHAPMLLEAFDELRALAPANDGGTLLFPSSHGVNQAQSKSGYRRGWKQALVDAAIPLRAGLGWHVLRHTCATGLLGGWFGKKWPKEGVQGILGHSTIAMTEKYCKLLDESLFEYAGAIVVPAANDTARELPVSPDTERDLSAYGESADNDVHAEAM